MKFCCNFAKIFIMRKFTSREKAIIKRIIDLHTEHPSIRIPVPVIYEKDVELKDCDYEGSRKEAINNIVINHNQPYIYESANLINVLEENGYLLLDKEHNDNAYRDEIATYTQYISDMQAAGWSYENDDAFPLKALFGRISPKLANILLNQIYANALVFDSLKELADDEFLTEEGKMLKEAQKQSELAKSSLEVAQRQTKEAISQTEYANQSLSEAKIQTQNAQSQTNIAQETLNEAQKQTKEAQKQTECANDTFREAKRTNCLSKAMLVVSIITLAVSVITSVITAYVNIKSLKGNSVKYNQEIGKEQIILKERDCLLQDSTTIKNINNTLDK